MDFAAIFQTWVKVLTQPNEQTFEAEKESPRRHPSDGPDLDIVGAAVVTAVLGFLQGLIFRGVATSSMQQFMDMADATAGNGPDDGDVTTSGGAGAALSGAGRIFGHHPGTPLLHARGGHLPPLDRQTSRRPGAVRQVCLPGRPRVPGAHLELPRLCWPSCRSRAAALGR